MRKYQDIGSNLLQRLLLLTTIASATSPQAIEPHPTPRVERPALTLDHRLHWHEDEAVGPRCFEVTVPTAGIWWIELRSSRPATAPSLWVMDAAGREGPKILKRVEGVLLHVRRAGDYRVCLTSQAPLGEVELGNSFAKDGDPDETEVVPDP